MENIFDTLLSNIKEPTFVSAIVGTVFGGLIAYCIQLKALFENRKQRAEDIRRTQEMLGNSLIIKMIQMHSDIYTIHQHVEESLRNVSDPKIEPWQVVQPLANPPDPVLFSSEELSMLMSMCDDRVFNMILPLDRVHSAILNIVKIHYSERTILLTLLGKDVVYTGNIGHTELDKDQFMRAKPQMITVNCIINQLHDHTKRYLGESKEALLALHELLQDIIKLKSKLEFDYLENMPKN